MLISMIKLVSYANIILLIIISGVVKFYEIKK